MAAMMAAAVAALMTTTVKQSGTRSSSKAATASSSSSTPDQNIGCIVDSNRGAKVAALMTTACSSSGMLYSDDYVESFCLREYLSCGVVEKVIFSTSSHSLTTQLLDYAALNCFLLS